MLRPARLLSVVALAVALGACGSDPAPAADSIGDEPSPPPVEGPHTVLSVVGETADLSTLASLVEGADVADLLRDTSGTVTLFAPSDAAFAALPAGTLDALRSDPAALRSVLLAHTLPTRLPSADVFAEIEFESAAGTDLTVDADDRGVSARGPGGAGRVTTPDLDATNGVVHVVDAVLALPPAL